MDACPRWLGHLDGLKKKHLYCTCHHSDMRLIKRNGNNKFEKLIVTIIILSNYKVSYEKKYTADTDTKEWKETRTNVVQTTRIYGVNRRRIKRRV